MITEQRTELPPVTSEIRQQILDAPRTEAAHRGLLAEVPAMHAVQRGGEAQKPVLPSSFRIATWNVERCLFPEESANHLTSIAPDIVLLSEVDHGMARSGQRHTTEVMASELGMVYAFGVEFHELGLGGATEQHFRKDDFNHLGWHGNAILSSVAFERVAMLRLDDHGHWFTDEYAKVDPDQPRIGGRMALLATVPTESGPLCVVSTHLESNADAAYRDAQFIKLLDAIDDFAPDIPVVIGGDLNTGNHMPPDYDWRAERLFARAEARGYRWEFTAEGHTTRPSLITPHPKRVMKLDWLAGRDLHGRDKGILSSLSASGKPLSDHDCVWSEISR